MYGYVAGLPGFLAYFGSGVVLILLFSAVYSMVTPQREFTLIKEGNCAAATAFIGGLIGFSLPLASAAANSVSIADFIIWAVIGAIVQLFAFGVAAATQSGLATRITQGNMAAGLWAGGIALVVGLLNAACMSY
jgi:putative membrane protein